MSSHKMQKKWLARKEKEHKKEVIMKVIAVIFSYPFAPL
jgi:hypothetical protein